MEFSNIQKETESEKLEVYEHTYYYPGGLHHSCPVAVTFHWVG